MEENLVGYLDELKMGNKAGLQKLFDATKQQVFFRALQYSEDEENAYQLVQKIYETLARDSVSCEDSDAVIRRLYELAYQEGIRLAAWDEENRQEDDFYVADGEELESNDFEISDEKSMVQREAEYVIKELMDELTPHQRAYLLGYYYDRFSALEMAEMEGQTKAEIKKRIAAVQNLIRQKMKEKEKQDGFRYLEASPILFYGSFRLLMEETCPDQKKENSCFMAICLNLGMQTGIHSGMTSVASPEWNSMPVYHERYSKSDEIPGITLDSESSRNWTYLFLAICWAIIAICVVSMVRAHRAGQDDNAMDISRNKEVSQTIDGEAAGQSQVPIQSEEPIQKTDNLEPVFPAPVIPEPEEKNLSQEEIRLNNVAQLFFDLARAEQSWGASRFYFADRDGDNVPEMYIPGFFDDGTNVYQVYEYNGVNSYTIYTIYATSAPKFKEPLYDCDREAFKAEISQYMP